MSSLRVRQSVSKTRDHHYKVRKTARNLEETDYSEEAPQQDDDMRDSLDASDSSREEHTHKRNSRIETKEDTSHGRRRYWKAQQEAIHYMDKSTPVRKGGTKSPFENKQWPINEDTQAERDDNTVEEQLKQQRAELGNIRAHLEETAYRTETVQRQAAYLLYKNSKREEDEAGRLATIFDFPKHATLQDRKANAKWLIEQAQVTEDHVEMTFTDNRGRLSNYAKIKFSNQGARDQFTYHWYKAVHKQQQKVYYFDMNTNKTTNDKLIIRAQYSAERMMRSAFIKAGKDVLKEHGLDEDTWMNTDTNTIADDKGTLLWIVFRHSTASAIVFADKTVYKEIYESEHFEDCLHKIRKRTPTGGKGKTGENENNDGKGKGKGKHMKGKAAKASFDFGYDYKRPYFIKYVKVDNWETQKEVRQEEEQEESAERALWEQAGMDEEMWQTSRRQRTCERGRKYYQYEKCHKSTKYEKRHWRRQFEKCHEHTKYEKCQKGTKYEKRKPYETFEKFSLKKREYRYQKINSPDNTFRYTTACIDNIGKGTVKRRAGKIAQHLVRSVYKPQTPTSAKDCQQPTNSHPQERNTTRRGKRNKMNIYKRLQTFNQERARKRKEWRKIKNADAKQVHQLAADVLEQNAAQEAAVAENMHNLNSISAKQILQNNKLNKGPERTKIISLFIESKRKTQRNKESRNRAKYLKTRDKRKKGLRNEEIHMKPTNSKPMVMGKGVVIASLNCRGLAENAKRQHLIHIMKEHQIDLLALQETKQKHNSLETLEGYTIYFSATPNMNLMTQRRGNQTTEHHGVGFIVAPSLKGHIIDCTPINERIMEIKIEAKGMNYTFINAYAPHSARPANEKQMFWNKLESRCNQIQRKSPTYIIGDFNARLYGRQISEHDIMGPFIFGPGTLALSQMTHDMMENRQNMVDFLQI